MRKYNRKITKQLAVSNIANSIKILKEIISTRSYNIEPYVANNCVNIIYDTMYSLRDLQYSLRGYRLSIGRSKQNNVYSIDEVVANLKNIIGCCSNEKFPSIIQSVIDLLMPVCEYYYGDSTTSHNISISQCALNGNVTEMQKSILLIDLQDLYKAETCLSNIVSGNGKACGARLIGQYVDDCKASGDLLTILTLKNRIKSVIADIDNVIDLIDKAQKDIIGLNNSSNSEQADLSEDDELY